MNEQEELKSGAAVVQGPKVEFFLSRCRCARHRKTAVRCDPYLVDLNDLEVGDAVISLEPAWNMLVAIHVPKCKPFVQGLARFGFN